MLTEPQAVPEPHVDFCGEIYPLRPEQPIVLGREGDIVVDDNPYLHRRFLQVSQEDGLWWLANKFDVCLTDASFVPALGDPVDVGQTTVGRTSFTPDQKLLMLALCESVLRRGNRGAGGVPSSAEAAERLGWTLTKFNRKLDNVCAKLANSGIRGLHGGPGKLATNRRARLVEYALAAQLVNAADLDSLDKLAVES